jgi:hypothetical protein
MAANIIESNSEQAVNQNDTLEQVEEKNGEEKKYSAGDSIEFNDDDQIEQKMAAKIEEDQVDENAHDDQNSENINDDLIEQKMIQNFEQEGTIIDKENSNVEINTDENIDSEAINSDEDIDSEADTWSEEGSDNEDADDEHDDSLYEKVEQNVIDNGNSIESESDNKDVEENKKNDDIEFEL